MGNYFGLAPNCHGFPSLSASVNHAIFWGKQAYARTQYAADQALRSITVDPEVQIMCRQDAVRRMCHWAITHMIFAKVQLENGDVIFVNPVAISEIRVAE